MLLSPWEMPAAGLMCRAGRGLIQSVRDAGLGEPTRDILRLSRGTDVALLCRQHIPVKRALQIPRDAVPVLVEAADDVLGADVAARRRGFVPFRGELPVLGRAAPQEVLRGELDLRLGMALLGRLLPPRRRAGERALYAKAALGEKSHLVLRLRHTRIGGTGKPSDGGVDVGGTALTAQEHHRHVELRQPIALASGRLV